MDTSRSYLEPSSFSKKIAAVIIIVYTVVTLIPISWMVMTSFKNVNSAISYPPEVLFEPSLEGYVNLFTNRSRQSQEYLDSLPPPENWYEELVRSREMVITGPSKFLGRYSNSMIIGFGSTFASVFLGALAAYAFSRFRVPLKDDLLFFILSTRMFPPIAVAVPIFIMYRKLGLGDTHLGMIILYTVVNLSLAVWLLKGFMDEIPKEYEEAAMIDGASRWQRMINVVVPHLMPLVIFLLLIQLMDNFRVFEPIIGFSAEAHATSLSWIIYNALRESGSPLFSSAGATSMITIIGVVILLVPLLVHTYRGYSQKAN